MAAEKKKRIADLNPPQSADSGGCPLVPLPQIPTEYEFFKSLVKNAITIEGLTYEEEEFFLERIFNSNFVGYDLIAKKFLRASPIYEKNDVLPRKATFFTETEKSYNVTLSYNAGGVQYLFKGFPSSTSFSEIVNNSTRIMQICDVSIVQNLCALRSPQILECDDPNTRLSLFHAIQQQQLGAPVVVVNKGFANALKSITTGVTPIFSELHEYRTQIRDELLNRLGTLTANVNKRERVQATEVQATVGQCEDSIYIVIDNLNKQFKNFGFEWRAKLNNSLEELYTEGGTEEPTEQEEK